MKSGKIYVNLSSMSLGTTTVDFKCAISLYSELTAMIIAFKNLKTKHVKFINLKELKEVYRYHYRPNTIIPPHRINVMFNTEFFCMKISPYGCHFESEGM